MVQWHLHSVVMQWRQRRWTFDDPNKSLLKNIETVFKFICIRVRRIVYDSYVHVTDDDWLRISTPWLWDIDDRQTSNHDHNRTHHDKGQEAYKQYLSHSHTHTIHNDFRRGNYKFISDGNDDDDGYGVGDSIDVAFKTSNKTWNRFVFAILWIENLSFIVHQLINVCRNGEY